jgi:putative tryptophan/tyrosine transport system substrate-binding protein
MCPEHAQQPAMPVIGFLSSGSQQSDVWRLVEFRRVDALVVVTDPLFNSRPHQLASLAARYALPTIYPYREFAAAGGLISYGGNLSEPWYLAGVYAGRILKGEKAADLPVQQTTKLTLVINLKTATSLGLTLPPTLLARADEVIE